MRRSQKTGIGILIIASLAAGYAVYWWHEAVLDQQAVASEPDEATAGTIAEIRGELAAIDIKQKTAGVARLDRLSNSERAEVLVALSEDRETSIRLLVVPHMAKLKEGYPAVRAALARLALSDPEREVKEAARNALGGGGNP